jgi:hypothetical protein
MGSTSRPERPSWVRRLAALSQDRRLPHVYLASALSNSVLNAQLAHALESHAWLCFLPQRDAPASDAGQDIATANMQAILGSDLVVALGYRMGKDTAWEVGFAVGRGIPVVLVCSRTELAALDLMVFHSGAAIVPMDPDDVPGLLPAVLDQWIADMLAGIKEV